MKKVVVIAIALCALLGAQTASAAHRPDTFVKRGKVGKVEFGPTHRTASVSTRCPGDSALVGGWVTIVQDGTPNGVVIAAQDVTADEQGWEATVQAVGLWSPGEEVGVARFQVAVICLR